MAGSILFVLFYFAAPALSCEAVGLWTRRARRSWVRLISLLICLTVLLRTVPVTVYAARASDSGAALSISIDTAYKTIRTGDAVEFRTTVTNHSGELSPQVLAAMNIFNLANIGDTVDPEDWSPERTQSIPPPAAGRSATQAWKIHAIQDGNYRVYMVLFPDPGGFERTSQPVASTGIHMTVAPFASLKLRSVLPLALGMPIGLTLLMFILLWKRNRSINVGRPSSVFANL